MKKSISYILMASIMLFFSSCNKWLEIDPEDRVMEDKLFKNTEGFLVALNGVYIELNSSTLYGGRLFNNFDAMAQYYDITGEHSYRFFANYSLQQDAVKNSFAGIWDVCYKMIANCNTIIEHCELKEQMLGPKYYNLIKGEALALRALLHFELIRIFGPVYSSNSEMASIPYMESSKLEIQPLLKANEISKKIMQDFSAAEALLEKADPVISEGPIFSYDPLGGTNDFRFRSIRLNYFAVQALEARAALYFNDKITAAAYAEKVIEAVHKPGNAMFPFVQNVVPTHFKEDGVFQPELLFSMYNMKRTDIFKQYFSNSLNNLSVLRIKDTILRNSIYEPTDYRFQHQFESLKGPDDNTTTYLIKYRDPGLADTAQARLKTFRFLVPVIRVSELYYIMAECSDDPATGLTYLNKTRNARSLPDLPAGTLIREQLDKEYRREFVGEGQLFFYYKRLGKTEIPSGTDISKTVTMNTERYVIQLPESETNNRLK